MKAACAVNLHNTITVSQDRLGKRVARLHGLRIKEIVVRYAFRSVAISPESTCAVD